MIIKHLIIIFIAFVWLTVFIFLFILGKINKANTLKSSRIKANVKYYRSAFGKIDKLIDKGEVFKEHNDVESELLYFGKAFESMLRLICKYKLSIDSNESTSFDSIQYICDKKIFSSEFCGKLHFARKIFNKIKHELDAEYIYKYEFLVSEIITTLYIETKKMLE